MKKQRKKNSIKNKKINLKIKGNIFKENNPNKEHTIIHNRNASLVVDNRNGKNKNLSVDGVNDKKFDLRNDFSYTPNKRGRYDNNERKNIINIYVQNKNNVNSNNIYNINLITKNNYSIDKSTDNKNRNNLNNNNNIKVKKIKISNQNIRYIVKKDPLNNNNFLNTTNICSLSATNRNKKNNKNEIQPHFKSQHIHKNKLNNIHNINIINRAQSQRNNKNINNNNSFNNFDKNKKRIRKTSKIKEEENIKNISDISLIKKEEKKSKKNDKNNKNIINNKYHHYKSQSMVDIDNPHTINTSHHNINNYTITENKIENYLSNRYSSVKNVKNNLRNNSIKQRKKMMNISFLNIHTNSNNINNNNNKQSEIKKYKGPIDLKCILYSNNINKIIEKIAKLLKRNRINVINLNSYKLRCTKNGQSYDLEFFMLNNNSFNVGKINNNMDNNINYSDNNSYIYENKYNLKTLSPISNYKMNKVENNNNIFYYTITSKVTNNKKLMTIIGKLIYSKFSLNKIKKEENI